jgi:hypothetical protein
MPTKYSKPYHVRLFDLLAVGVLVGGAHYLSNLVVDFQSAASISSAINSANVGVTAAFGALVYTAYRFFKPTSMQDA